MEQIWKILKKIGSWIIGVCSIIFALLSFSETTFWVSHILVIFLVIIGLYIIPPINKYVSLGLSPIIITVILIFSILGIPISEDQHSKNDNEGGFYVTAKFLNVRENQGTDNKILFKLKKGDNVKVLSQKENWAKVQTKDGNTGYVSCDFLSDESPDDWDAGSWIILIIVLFAFFKVTVDLLPINSRTNKSVEISSINNNIDTKRTKNNSNTNDNPTYFLTVDNGVVYLGQERTTMKRSVYQTLSKAIDCDLENNKDNRSRFLVVTTDGDVHLCQLGNTGKKEVFRNFVSFGKAYKAKFASNDSFYFDTDIGKYKGYFNSTRKDKLR